MVDAKDCPKCVAFLVCAVRDNSEDCLIVQENIKKLKDEGEN